MKVSLSIIALAIATLLAGCASQTQLAKVEPNQWTALTCSGFLTWNECRQEARSICPNGFLMSNQLENLLIQRREISITCKR